MNKIEKKKVRKVQLSWKKKLSKILQVECGKQEEERIPDMNRNRDLGILCAAQNIT